MSDRLYRSRRDRMLAGVAGGLAEMWGADPSLVRIVWALLVFLTGGLALVVYIVMAIVVPEGDPAPWPSEAAGEDAGEGGGTAPVTGAGWAPAGTRPPRPRRDGPSAFPMVVGGFLILLGAFFLVREYLPQIDFDWFWPAMLIGLGVIILLGAIGRDRERPGGGS
jgi:phage shock protein C